jgi:hypothetical protein
MTFVKHLEFETAADRNEYIVARGWGS